MSTEHENGEHDELVSTAYRELGTEKDTGCGQTYSLWMWTITWHEVWR